MSHKISYDRVKAPHSNNDNYPPALCTEVYTPSCGWVIYVNTGGSEIERMTLNDLIQRIYLIENGKRNRCYLDQAKDLRACLERIVLFRIRGAV